MTCFASVVDTLQVVRRSRLSAEDVSQSVSVAYRPSGPLRLLFDTLYRRAATSSRRRKQADKQRLRLPRRRARRLAGHTVGSLAVCVGCRAARPPAVECLRSTGDVTRPSGLVVTMFVCLMNAGGAALMALRRQLSSPSAVPTSEDAAAENRRLQII